MAKHACDSGFTLKWTPTSGFESDATLEQSRQQACTVASEAAASWSPLTDGVLRCAAITCSQFDEAWMDIGVAMDAGGSSSITSPARTVDWTAPLFGDQLAFKCSDTNALVGGPSSPTCVATGLWRPAISADNKVLCSCPIGNFMENTGMCEECPANTYAAEPGSKECALCDFTLGETSLPGSAMCTRAKLECPDGTYQDEAMAACLSCLKSGAICEDNEITLLDGWWYEGKNGLAQSGEEISGETEVFMCLNELACATDVKNITVTCNEGYIGVLCGGCNLKEENYMRSGQLCRKCDSFLYNIVFVAGMGSIAIGYILYVIAFQNFSSKQNDQRGVVMKIAMSFCQMLTVLGVFKARGTALFNEIVQRPASIAGGGISSALPLKCLLNSQIYGTFVMNILTPIFACALTALLMGPVWIAKRVQEAVLASFPPPRAPIEKIRVLCCCRTEKMASWERKMWMHKRKDRVTFQPGPRFVAVLVFVLFGIYPTLVKSIFAIFRCSAPIGGKSYLEDDYNVQCWVGYHPAFVLIAATFGVVYLFGIPFGLLLILKVNRHRLDEPRFMATFGFVYNGYDINRGLVVAWESFVMLRKLAVTAITVSSSDPYIQIFVALLLLIISYGMQERVMPFETMNLNNIEGVGLFSLIFTQIVSILYLYIDSRAAATGKKDKVLEYIVTAVLMFANFAIAAAMVGAYLFAWKKQHDSAHREYHEFIEERDEPFGGLSRYRNPRIEPVERLEVFRTKEDCDVHVRPMLSAEKTGEIMEGGKEMLVSEQLTEYVRPRCRRGREVSWLKLTDGTGWVLDTNLRSGNPAVELVGHRENDGTVELTFLRFQTVMNTPIPIRAGTSGFPFVWPTGEFVMPGESFLVDMRFVRSSRCCCNVKRETYLHLADRRGWIVEPSFVPDVDWIDEPDFVDESVLVRLTGTEEHVRGLSSVGVSEYDALDYDVPIYAKDTWPLTMEIDVIPSGTRFFVDERSHVFTRLRFTYIICFGQGCSICFPRSFRCCRRVGRFATFVKLSDGKGYALINRRSDDTKLVCFAGLRTDSVGQDSRSMLRWRYRTSEGSTVYHSANAALLSISARKGKLQREPSLAHLHVEYAPLLAGEEVSISVRRVIKPKGAVKFEVTVGKIERGMRGEGMGWIVLAPVDDGDMELVGETIAKDHARVLAEERSRARAKRERKEARLRLMAQGLLEWWNVSKIACGDTVVHPIEGPGIVVAINPEDDYMVPDEMVHVEFISSFETQCFTEVTWGELTHTLNSWWTRRWNGGVVIGAKVSHRKRGTGTITAISPEDDRRVHVTFDNGDVHRYAEQSWTKLSRVRSEKMEKMNLSVNPMLANHSAPRMAHASVRFNGNPMRRGKTVSAGWLDPEKVSWMYEGVSADDLHGPFSLSKLKRWRDKGHFLNNQKVQQGMETLELLEALHRAGIDDDAWWYDGLHGQHGPYTKAQLHTWLSEAHFDAKLMVRRGRYGEPVALGDLVREVNLTYSNPMLATCETTSQSTVADDMLFTANPMATLKAKAKATPRSAMADDLEFTANPMRAERLAQTGEAHVHLEFTANPMRGEKHAHAGAASATASALDPDEVCWVYEGVTAADMHGPFALSKLKRWRDKDHLLNNQMVQRQRAADAEQLELLEALHRAGLDDDAWWYDGLDGQHGPYTEAQLRAWLIEDHFEATTLVKRGPYGIPIALSELVPLSERLEEVRGLAPSTTRGDVRDALLRDDELAVSLALRVPDRSEQHVIDIGVEDEVHSDDSESESSEVLLTGELRAENFDTLLHAEAAFPEGIADLSRFMALFTDEAMELLAEVAQAHGKNGWMMIDELRTVMGEERLCSVVASHAWWKMQLHLCNLSLPEASPYDGEWFGLPQLLHLDAEHG